MPKQQKSRAPKTSSGSGVKHRKTKMDPIALIIMGKGLYRSMKPINGSK